MADGPWAYRSALPKFDVTVATSEPDVVQLLSDGETHRLSYHEAIRLRDAITEALDTTNGLRAYCTECGVSMVVRDKSWVAATRLCPAGGSHKPWTRPWPGTVLG